MKTIIHSFFIFILFIFFSCKKNDVTNNSSSSSSAGLNKGLMLQLVNDQRARGCNCGSVYYPPAPALNWNDQLETAANLHAGDMYKNNFFSHTGSNNSTPGDRIRTAGYNWYAYGENIAKGYSTEQAVMTAWIQSEEHCVNIMNPSFRDFGAARVGNYWVQEFGSR